MRRTWRYVALIALVAAVMALAGTSAITYASRPVYIECMRCETNKDCGYPQTNLRCNDSGFCSSNPFVGCE